MPLKVLIVDDDERERIVLCYLLEQIDNVEIVGEAIHGLEALMICQEKKVDLVFLDISMPEMGGMETAEKLQELKSPPLFVFVTVKKDMAVEAFEIGALDYIVKPIEQQRIEKTIQRVRFQIAHWTAVEGMVSNRVRDRIDYILETCKDMDRHSNRLFIREKGKISLVDQPDIVYCESQGKKVLICTCEQKYASNYTLNALENILDARYFFRVHQAFIVNVNYIREVINLGEGSYILHLADCDKDIILSRAKARLLRNKMGIS